MNFIRSPIIKEFSDLSKPPWEKLNMVNKVSVSLLQLHHHTVGIVLGIARGQDITNSILSVLYEFALRKIQNIWKVKYFFLVNFTHTLNHLLLTSKVLCEKAIGSLVVKVCLINN